MDPSAWTNLPNPPRDWNGYYYIVIVGEKPGIYFSWGACFGAVGAGNYFTGRGKWRKLLSLEGIEELMKFAVAIESPPLSAAEVMTGVPPSPEKNKNPSQAHRENEYMGTSQSEEQMLELKKLREEQGQCMQMMRQMAEKLERVESTMSRLEFSMSSQNNVPRTSMDCAVDRLSASVSGPANLEYVNGDFASVYVKGKLFTSPGGGDKAGVGVWFSETSAWNFSSNCFTEFTPSKCNVEIAAAVIAIKIALKLGEKKLCVFTKSQFLYNRVIPNWNTTGASQVLLEMLKTHAEILEHIDWVYCTKETPGIEKAKQLASKGAEKD